MGGLLYALKKVSLLHMHFLACRANNSIRWGRGKWQAKRTLTVYIHVGGLQTAG